MYFEVVGKITEIAEVKTGTSKAGKAWKSIGFMLETEDQYDNEYWFTMFGEEKVDNFVKFNKVGSIVKVKFNVRTRKWQDKKFTDLSVFGVYNEQSSSSDTTPKQDDLPF